MCPPQTFTGIMAVAQLAATAYATQAANTAAKKQSNAIAQQAQVRKEAEIRSHAVNTSLKRREAEKASAQNEALMAALGISGGFGTAPGIIGAPKAAFSVENVFAQEALGNRLFAIESGAANQINDIRFQQSARNFQFLSGSLVTAGKAYSAFNTETPATTGTVFNAPNTASP